MRISRTTLYRSVAGTTPGLEFDRATREARLRGGDAGWDNAHPVRDGRVDGLILAPEEMAWLQACWSVTRA